MNTPEDITEMKPNEVFVFGSNTDGIHGAGAAKLAWEKFGACFKIAEGIMGNSYALPTLTGYLTQRSVSELRTSAARLAHTARALPAVTFYLTKVGCGLAGFTEAEIAPLFADMPPNVIKPKGW